ncbi:hypothetical protein C1637_09805 [Chryseobacterium lactis]|uniref:Uncharacterized protein n=1 Tax=Chryseobacterium lactis TaxID=1241981 RepID=A0A3G6RL56_CHRLC|nr:hypothetical protein [Chryseobacterium lactis]AZA82195.1 hypothetical protein EG342_09895 [Chryseobacterium lactis]AZB02576.1 hypothetical protein EG341_00750 [Chryseobacterium lactis]PNW14129.1 hypothetical protein C1637_09805 [Chryseobacterium lactis]
MDLALQELGFIKVKYYEYTLNVNKEVPTDLIVYLGVSDHNGKVSNNVFLDQRGVSIFLFDFDKIEQIDNLLKALKKG